MRKILNFTVTKIDGISATLIYEKGNLNKDFQEVME